MRGRTEVHNGQSENELVDAVPSPTNSTSPNRENCRHPEFGLWKMSLPSRVWASTPPWWCTGRRSTWRRWCCRRRWCRSWGPATFPGRWRCPRRKRNSPAGPRSPRSRSKALGVYPPSPSRLCVGENKPVWIIYETGLNRFAWLT